MRIKEFQSRMADFVWHNDEPNALKKITRSYEDDEFKARLAIYKNNTFHSLTEALKDLYPTIVITIGEKLFGASARIFLENQKPSSPAMVFFGKQFPSFIESFSPLQNYDYLADLARADLMRHESYHAQDCAPLPPSYFAKLGIEQLTRAGIEPIPSVRMLSSHYAIFDMWQLAHEEHQTDETVDADLAQYVLSIRPAMQVDFYRLDKGTFNFLQALSKGESLADALEVGLLHADKEFNPAEAISFMINSGFSANLHGANT
ncbi:MAG: hypothetical protein ACI9Y1_001496 [Lentisphaeria bacterium]|jgi:hypothetical protein